MVLIEQTTTKAKETECPRLALFTYREYELCGISEQQKLTVHHFIEQPSLGSSGPDCMMH